MRGLIGVGYRRELKDWILTFPPEISCLEITAEHFFDSNQSTLELLSQRYPLFVHGLGLSLGTPGPLDAQTLKLFSRVVKTANPQWISEHIAFTRTPDIDLGHLNPIPPTKENVQLIADHARQVSDVCEKPIILENITSHVRFKGELSEPDFLNAICEKANCGLLLDATNLFINSRNHDFNPMDWIQALDPMRIVQLHIVGYSQVNGLFEDFHAENIQQELFDLTQWILNYAPVQAIIIERDQNFRSTQELASDLLKLIEIANINHVEG